LVLQNDEKRAKLIEKLKLTFAHEQIFKDIRDNKLNVDNDPDIDIAFKILYLHTYSYFGDSHAFMRYYIHKNVPKFNIENFIFVRNWVIENKDFRIIMGKYNKNNVLFYLDPPYLKTGKRYKNSFNMQDFLDLKDILNKTQANYILNLSLYDKEMINIFGEPNFVKEYKLPASNTNNPPKSGDKWKMGFWYKFNENFKVKNSNIITLENFQ